LLSGQNSSSDVDSYDDSSRADFVSSTGIATGTGTGAGAGTGVMTLPSTLYYRLKYAISAMNKAFSTLYQHHLLAVAMSMLVFVCIWLAIASSIDSSASSVKPVRIHVYEPEPEHVRRAVSMSQVPQAACAHVEEGDESDVCMAWRMLEHRGLATDAIVLAVPPDIDTFQPSHTDRYEQVLWLAVRPAQDINQLNKQLNDARAWKYSVWVSHCGSFVKNDLSSVSPEAIQIMRNIYALADIILLRSLEERLLWKVDAYATSGSEIVHTLALTVTDASPISLPHTEMISSQSTRKCVSFHMRRSRIATDQQLRLIREIWSVSPQTQLLLHVPSHDSTSTNEWTRSKTFARVNTLARDPRVVLVVWDTDFIPPDSTVLSLFRELSPNPSALAQMMHSPAMPIARLSCDRIVMEHLLRDVRDRTHIELIDPKQYKFMGTSVADLSDTQMASSTLNKLVQDWTLRLWDDLDGSVALARGKETPSIPLQPEYRSLDFSLTIFKLYFDDNSAKQLTLNESIQTCMRTGGPHLTHCWDAEALAPSLFQDKRMQQQLCENSAMLAVARQLPYMFSNTKASSTTTHWIGLASWSEYTKILYHGSLYEALLDPSVHARERLAVEQVLASGHNEPAVLGFEIWDFEHDREFNPHDMMAYADDMHPGLSQVMLQTLKSLFRHTDLITSDELNALVDALPAHGRWYYCNYHVMDKSSFLTFTRLLSLFITELIRLYPAPWVVCPYSAKAPVYAERVGLERCFAFVIERVVNYWAFFSQRRMFMMKQGTAVDIAPLHSRHKHLEGGSAIASTSTAIWEKLFTDEHVNALYDSSRLKQMHQMQTRHRG
jgi:hypothetical protein